MAWDPTPWMIGGGAEHSVEVARLLAYAATGSAEGVVTPSDLRVTPLDVPGGKVRIMPGACVIRQRYGGTPRQSYMGRNVAATEVSITPTGSGGKRSDLLVARVLDPQYEGSAPPDPNDFQYMRHEVIEGVPAGTVTFAELGLNYPAIALARIDLPASTGTVEASHIVDLRQVAQPRRESALRTFALTGGDEDRLEATGPFPSGGEVWPNAAVLDWDPGVWVPEWATRMRIVMMWSGIRMPAGTAWGEAWVQIGGFGSAPESITQTTRWQAPGSSATSRMVHVVADDRAVHVDHRGRFRRFYPMAYVGSGVPSNQRPLLDAASSVVLQVEFYEQAD